MCKKMRVHVERRKYSIESPFRKQLVHMENTREKFRDTSLSTNSAQTGKR
jgi:hypothetical protein